MRLGVSWNAPMRARGFPTMPPSLRRLKTPDWQPRPFPATDDDTWGGPWPTREWLIPRLAPRRDDLAW